jgi:Flp pilus assembly protein TadG
VSNYRYPGNSEQAAGAVRWQERVIPRRRARRRRGTAVVEFAIAAPVLFLTIFASIEFARVHMIRNTIGNACYEAARRGIVPGVTAQDVRDEANLLLSTASIAGATVTVTPTTIQHTTPEVTVSISVPMNANGWIAPMFFGGKTLAASSTLARESYGEP